MVAESGILDCIEDDTGQSGEGSSLDLCFLVYSLPISPFFHHSHVLTYTAYWQLGLRKWLYIILCMYMILYWMVSLAAFL